MGESTILKSIFKTLAVILPLFSMQSCSVETSIEGEFLLNTRFKLIKELSGGEQCPEEKRWFTSQTLLTTMPDETCSLLLKKSNGTESTLVGSYWLSAFKSGHSGSGYIQFDGEKTDLLFENSYFLTFSLSSIYAADQTSGKTRTLYFQRW